MFPLSVAGVGAVMNATTPRMNSITGPGSKTPSAKNKSINGVSTDNQINTPNAIGNRWV
jgi:hypothetical protein